MYLIDAARRKLLSALIQDKYLYFTRGKNSIGEKIDVAPINMAWNSGADLFIAWRVSIYTWKYV